MSAVAAYARERVRLAVSADAVSLAALGMFAVVVVALTWKTWGDLNGDTGHDFVAGTRFAHGQLPYVDEHYYYGPLAPALLGLAARLGGSGVDSFVVFGLVVTAAIVLATYALARLYVGPRGALLAGAIVVPVAFEPHQFSFVLPHTSAATLGVLALLCTLLALGRHRPGLAGLCIGLAALTKPEFVLAAAAAAVAWLALRGSRRSWTLVVAPALAIPAAVYGAFLTSVSLHRLVYENLDPRAFLNAAGNTILRARTPWTLSSFVHLGAKLALYAVGVAALLAAARVASGSLRRPALAVLAFAAVLAALAAVADPEALRHGLQFVYGWIPAGAVVAALVVARRRAQPLELAGLVALAILAGTNYAAFYAYSWKAQMATYAVPLAAIFLVRLHLVELASRRTAALLGAAWLALVAAAGLGLTLKDAHAESAWVRGPGGSLKDTPALASAYQHAVDAITARTAPGEPVLLAPEMTWMYSLSGRTNPLGELNLLPGTLAGPGAQSAAIARLQAARVRLAVIDRRGWPGFGQTSFGGSFDQTLDGWIRAHFHRIAVYVTGSDVESPRLELWVRKRP